MQFHNDRFTDQILYFARTANIPGYDWQDVAQELDLALWLKMDKFTGKNGCSERTFAGRILKNRVIDLARGANRIKRKIDSSHIVFSELSDAERDRLGIS
jgi:DNA-directed RNA polymerase specialized sigma24 family protein